MLSWPARCAGCAAALAALSTSALSRVGLNVPRDGIAEDGRQGGSRVTGRSPGIPAGRDLPLPGADFLRRDGGQGTVPERGQDMHFDLVPVVAQSRRLEIQSGIPLVHPFGGRDPSRARMDIGVGADGGFLVTGIVLGGPAGLEAGFGLQRAVWSASARTPQVSPLFRIGHRISRESIRAPAARSSGPSRAVARSWP
jgi:hypothetical protein